MRLLLHLVRKELRDVRWHVRGAALGSLAIAAAVFGLLRSEIAPTDDTGAGTTAGCALVVTFLGGLLAGVAVAAETFAGEASSRRVDGVALLPIGLGRAFAAKVLAVLVAAAALTVWSAAAAVGAAAAFLPDGAALDAAAEMWTLPAGFAGLLAVLAAVTLFAVVLEHGLGSVVAGVVVGGASFVSLGVFVPWEEWGLGDGPAEFAAVALAFVATLGGAAWLAYVHGPIHLGRRVRRAALGLGGSLAVVGAGGPAAWAALDARGDLAAGDEDAAVATLHAEPRGRFAVAQVRNERAPRNDHVWLADLERGTFLAVPHRRASFHSWAEDGSPRIRLVELNAFRRPSEIRVVTYDAATGRVVRTQSEEQVAAEPRTDGWATVAKTPDGWRVDWVERKLARQFPGATRVAAAPRAGRVVVWSQEATRVVHLDAGAERVLPPEVREPLVWSEDGRTLHWRPAGGGVRALDVETGADREVLARGASVAAAGAFAVVRERQEVRVVDVRDGRTVAGPWTDAWVDFVPGSDRFVLAGWAPTRLVDLRTGAVVRTATWLHGSLHALPGERVLHATGGGGLAVEDAAGRSVRALVPAPR